MWSYIVRRVIYNVPVYLGILLLMMLALRVRDPVYGRLSKNPTKEEIAAKRHELGIDRPLYQQYLSLIKQVGTLTFDEGSWEYPGQSVGEVMRRCVGPSLAITIPSLILTTILSISVSLMSAWFRGRPPDRVLVFLSVLGMSVSFLVYIIIGQYFGAYRLSEATGHEVFAIYYNPEVTNAGWSEFLTSVWPRYYLLPVLISVIVAMGYDTRFYRAVMVEESARDYIVTATAKGASRFRIMFIHMLKNAMIPIITRVVITIPFLITGSFLLERYFGIPGMGNQLIMAVEGGDFPIVQAFTAVFAAVYIASNLATDILYALVDPRVRLS
jgi:peptide/nickel transport system permease protein